MLATTRALGATLFRSAAGPVPADRLDWLCRDLDHFFRQAGPRARFVYQLCLLGISVLAPLLVLRPPPFRRLRDDLRVTALSRLETSPFGLALFGARALISIVYYEHPVPAKSIRHEEHSP
jgi:hypothetical protein